MALTKTQFIQSGTGASNTIIRDKLKDTLSIKDFGATIDGSDDSTAITNARTQQNTQGGPLFIPAGTIDVSGTDYTNVGGLTYYNDSFSTGVNLADSARNNLILLTAETETDSTLNDAKAKIPLSITVTSKGAQHASGVRSNLYNQSTDGNGCTALYGHSANYTTGLWGAGVHSETRHNGGTSIGLNSENAGYSTSGSMYGVVVQNTTGINEVHPEDSTTSDAAPSTKTAILVQGSEYTLVGNPSGDSAVSDHGRWNTGLHITQDSIVGTSGTAIKIEGEQQTGVGGIPIGIDLTGTYTTSAIRTTGVILPATDGDIDLGHTSKRWQNFYATGATIDNVAIGMTEANTIGTSTGNLNLGSANGIVNLTNPGGTVSLEVGNGATGDHTAHIDLISDSTHVDYGGRIIRGGGADSNLDILQQGSGTINITPAGGDVRLYHAGALKFQTTSGGCTVTSALTETSDIALKENIQPLSNSLANLKQLNGYSYKFKDTGAKSLGLTAQEVEKVYPDLVDGEEGKKGLRYSGLIAPLLEAIKELSTEVETLKTKVAALEAK